MTKDRILSFLGIITIGVTATIYLLHLASASSHFANSDFYTFYQSMRFYFSGQDIYAQTIALGKGHAHLASNGDLNPPFFTLLLLPLYQLNYASALCLWVSIAIALTLLNSWLVLENFPEFKLASWQKIWIAALFLIYIPNSIAFVYGQITALIMLLLLIAWSEARKNNDITAGLLLGIAASIKLFCGLFFVFFLLQKRFRLITAMVTSGILCLLLGWIIFGIQAYIHYFTLMHKISWYASSWNASFFGFFVRVFGFKETNVPLFNLPHATHIATLLCDSLLLLYLLWAWWRKQDLDLGYSLTLISMLLLSPLGWVYYFPILMIPYFILIQRTKNNPIIHMLACGALLLSSTMGILLKTPEIKTAKMILLSGGMGFYALLMMLFLFIYLSSRACFASSSISIQKQVPSQLYNIIYLLTFSPSFYSLAQLAKHLK